MAASVFFWGGGGGVFFVCVLVGRGFFCFVLLPLRLYWTSR